MKRESKKEQPKIETVRTRVYKDDFVSFSQVSKAAAYKTSEFSSMGIQLFAQIYDKLGNNSHLFLEKDNHLCEISLPTIADVKEETKPEHESIQIRVRKDSYEECDRLERPAQYKTIEFFSMSLRFLTKLFCQLGPDGRLVIKKENKEIEITVPLTKTALKNIQEKSIVMPVE